MATASITTLVAGSIDYTLYRSCTGPPLYFITDKSLRRRLVQWYLFCCDNEAAMIVLCCE